MRKPHFPRLRVAPVAVLAALHAGQGVYRTTTDVVPVHVVVRDASGEAVSGLSRDDFVVAIDGREVPLVAFDSAPQPLTAALLVDTSVFGAHQFARTLDLAASFVDVLQPDDRAFVGGFGADVFASPLLTGDRATLRRVLEEELWPSGGVWSPVFVALDASIARLAGESGRRAVIVVGHGGFACPSGLGSWCVDSRSVKRAAGLANVSISFVHVPSRSYDPRHGALIGRPVPLLRSEVTDIVAATGGRARTLTTETAGDAGYVRRLVDDLRRGYLLGVEPPMADGREHRIEVRVRGSDLNIVARTHFVAGER